MDCQAPLALRKCSGPVEISVPSVPSGSTKVRELRERRSGNSRRSPPCRKRPSGGPPTGVVFASPGVNTTGSGPPAAGWATAEAGTIPANTASTNRLLSRERVLRDLVMEPPVHPAPLVRWSFGHRSSGQVAGKIRTVVTNVKY